jgi:SAM-dependent methyltransferase
VAENADERALPPEFAARLDELERSYLAETDPIRGSGFGGGAERWRSEREPILDGVRASGDILDVGCANGHLLCCLVKWGAERGLVLTPHGVDRAAGLVERARALLPSHAANMHVADAWTWMPPRTYDHVYALHDCVPLDYLGEYVERLLDRAVAPGGRLIVGAYGSRSRGLEPFDVTAFLRSRGYRIVGTSSGGSPVVARFTWIERSRR